MSLAKTHCPVKQGNTVLAIRTLWLNPCHALAQIYFKAILWVSSSKTLASPPLLIHNFNSPVLMPFLTWVDPASKTQRPNQLSIDTQARGVQCTWVVPPGGFLGNSSLTPQGIPPREWSLGAQLHDAQPERWACAHLAQPESAGLRGALQGLHGFWPFECNTAWALLELPFPAFSPECQY